MTGSGTLPYHLNSHFIAVRKDILKSAAFRSYWDNMVPIKSYVDSVLKHESFFTGHFSDMGFKVATYNEADDYGSPYPAFIDIDETIRDRCPILKRRLFFHDTAFMDAHAVDLPRALRLISEVSDYNQDMIWKNIVRTTKLRTLNTNAGLLSVLPDVAEGPIVVDPACGRLAVCLHVADLDLLDEVEELLRNMPSSFDLLVTTDSQAKKQTIETAFAGRAGIEKLDVRAVAKNRGGDIAALFIEFRDAFLSDEYEFVCRLHTKKLSDEQQSRSSAFRRHLFENLMNSPGYVTNVLRLMRANGNIGVAAPPAMPFSQSFLGHGWSGVHDQVKKVAGQLGLEAQFDEHTPVAVYGNMFWFRPKSLRPLFEHEWSYDQFYLDSSSHKGNLALTLERLICYVAQNQGYLTWHILSPVSAAFNYTWLEYKVAQMQSFLPSGEIYYNSDFLRRWKDAGYPLAGPVALSPASPNAGDQPSVKAAFHIFRRAIKRWIKRAFSRKKKA